MAVFHFRNHNHKKLQAAVNIMVGTAAVCVSSVAFASGLDSGTSAATTFKTFLYTFIGIVALCYLLYKGAMAFTDREHWSDFAGACLKVAVVGSVVGVLGPYLWALFTS
jgi:drug/metabolite transporter (DMT)-like permease